jgi:nitrite reductase/ring-hydroxylating ferredoxin subunit
MTTPNTIEHAASGRTRAKVSAGREADFEVGKFRIISVGRREIGVIKLVSGQWTAVLNYCPHRGAPVCKGHVGGTWPPCGPGELSFEKRGTVLVCPWHGYEFDLETGTELFQERPARLRLYPVQVEDGEVVVTV